MWGSRRGLALRWLQSLLSYKTVPIGFNLSLFSQYGFDIFRLLNNVWKLNRLMLAVWRTVHNWKPSSASIAVLGFGFENGFVILILNMWVETNLLTWGEKKLFMVLQWGLSSFLVHKFYTLITVICIRNIDVGKYLLNIKKYYSNNSWKIGFHIWQSTNYNIPMLCITVL